MISLQLTSQAAGVSVEMYVDGLSSMSTADDLGAGTAWYIGADIGKARRQQTRVIF